MQSATNCRIRDQHVVRERETLLEKPEHYVRKEADFIGTQMIMVTLHVRLMLSTSVGFEKREREKKKHQIKITIHSWKGNLFPAQVVKSRTWPWLCSLCGENWGMALIKLHEERFTGSWTHIVSGGGSSPSTQGTTLVNIPGRGCRDAPQAACGDLLAESLDIVRLYWLIYACCMDDGAALMDGVEV